MRRAILAFAALLCAAIVGNQPAAAADIPVLKARPTAVVAPFSWTGIYIGGHFGYGWAKKDWTDPLAVAPEDNIGGHTATGWLGGVQLGGNYQMGNWVFGVEGQYSWAKLTGSHNNPFDPVDLLETKVHALARLTGRVGYAFDRTLVYVKGGGAWVRESFAIIDAGIIEGLANGTRSGWVAGVGVEYAFQNNWSARLEYNYMGFGTKRYDFISPEDGLTEPIDIKQRVQTITLGLNYRFAPLGTRY
jgi:outer membrane immunogenic protein